MDRFGRARLVGARIASLAAVLLAGLALVPALAAAATVRLDGSTLEIVGDLAFALDVEVNCKPASSATCSVSVLNFGSLRAGTGCTKTVASDGDDVVRCPSAAVARISFKGGPPFEGVSLEDGTTPPSRIDLGADGDFGFGGEGNDVILGGLGNDLLKGDNGSDTLEGGAGTDELDANDGEPDKLDCGLGIDDRITVDLKDTVSSNCENGQRAFVDQHPTVQIRTRRIAVGRGPNVPVRLACPRVLRRACKGRLELERSRPRHRLARRAYRIPAGRSRAVKLRLSAAALRSLKRARAVRAIARERDPRGRPKTTIATLKIKRQ